MSGKLITRTSLLQILSAHQAEFTVLLFRVLQAVAGLVTLILIGIFLTPQEQGIYYTFASVAAIQTILDMGLAVVLVQLSAHKFLGLSWEKQGGIRGEHALGFLAFFKSAVIWYGVATLVFLLIYPVGLIFFAESADVQDLSVNWQGVWAGLVLFTALNLFLQPFLSVNEGSGQVVATYRLRLLQTLLGAGAAWAAFLAGHGLYAVFMMPVMAVIVTTTWLLCRKRDWLLSLFQSRLQGFSWRQEVWPLQWKLGVSWICGYFLTQLYTPILFKTQGAVVAGQMGLSITIINMIGLIALSTMTAKVPRLGQLASNGQWLELDQLFRKGLFSSLLLFSVGGLSLLVILYFLADTEYHVRFLPWGQFVILMIAILAANVVNALAMFFRAYRQERLMWLYVLNALLASSFSYLVAPSWGSAGIVSTLFLVNTLLVLPVAVVIWIKFRLRLMRP